MTVTNVSESGKYQPLGILLDLKTAMFLRRKTKAFDRSIQLYICLIIHMFGVR